MRRVSISSVVPAGHPPKDTTRPPRRTRANASRHPSTCPVHSIHQVGPEAAVEPRDFGCGVARGDVDHAIGAEASRLLEAIRAAPGYRFVEYARPPQTTFSSR
jgi:hypothetical protein